MSKGTKRHSDVSLEDQQDLSESPRKRSKGSSEENEQENDEEELLLDEENVQNNATRSSTSRRLSQGNSQGSGLSEHGVSANINDNNDNDDAEEVASVVQPRRSINKEGKPAEAGIIKRIYVENFMCHTKLTVDLCRNVNFVHGQNGSGKSAILAAIQICLGATARRTNRARNLKELVRKETSAGAAPNCARIRVTLLNQGSDGYKPEVYGDEITVERTISLGGGYDGYKLLNDKGVEKSRDKKDLYEMLDMLNIQVENPVAVLDQEEAKKFLTGKGTDKYAFFLKACELERTKKLYDAAWEKYDEMRNNHNKASQSLEPGMERVDKLRGKYEEHKKLDDLRFKVQSMSVKYAWAVYLEHKDAHDATAEKMDEFKEKAKAKQDELTQAEEAAKSPDDEGNEKSQRIKDLSNEAGEATTEKQQLEESLKQAQAPFKEKERALKSHKKRQLQAQKNLEKAKKTLKEVRQEILEKEGSHESEEAQRAKALEEAETKLEEAKAQVDLLKQQQTDARGEYEEAESRATSARAALQHAEKQVDHADRNLETLQRSGSNPLNVFGRNVAAVAKMVQEAKQRGKFRGPVEGPIGAHLKIVEGKEEFAELIEATLGNGMLDRFVVTNSHDQKLLQEIRRKAQCVQDCGVLLVPGHGRYNVLPPPEGVETVVSVLSIDNDLLFNALVDGCKIDKIALGRSKDESQSKLLVTASNGAMSVRGGKITQCYFLPKGDFWQIKNGQISVLSTEKKLRNIIAADKSGAIAAAKREVDQYEVELEKAKKEAHHWEGAHNKCQKAWNQANRARSANDKKIDKLERDIEEMRTDMENAAPDSAVDLGPYEDEVRSSEAEVSKLNNERTEMTREIEELKPQIAELESQIEEVSIRNEKVLADLTEAEQAMEQFLATQSQQQDLIQKKRDKLAKYQNAIEMHQKKVDAAFEAMEEHLHTARTLNYRLRFAKKRRESQGPDSTPFDEEGDVPDPTADDLAEIEAPPLDKNSKYFEAKLSRSKERVKQEKERRKLLDSTIEEAYMAWINAQEEIDGKRQEIERMDTQIQEISVDLKSRKERWRQFRSYLQDQTAMKFAEFLSTNNFKGDLDFDHKAGSLDLCVQKRGSSAKNSQTNDVKSLSGGERSFTTVSLLLALGESLETPFRILDEFDVFLDAQVRKQTIKTLIHMAKKMVHRQFIFITPQDLTGITPDPQLKIMKLRPPVRHLAVEAATQQTLEVSQRE